MTNPATYVQITTVCNMSCAHCGYNCKRKGEHMSLLTFKEAIKWNRGCLNIGGGEPTMNPHLMEMIEMALTMPNRIWMVTNGKKKRLALKLAKLCKDIGNRKRFECKLSQDPWHEPVSKEVIDAFYDIGEIHDVSKGKGPIYGGRWKGKRRIACQNSNKPFVKPDGRVYQCGCADAPVIGDVFNGFHPIDGLWKCCHGLPCPGGDGYPLPAVNYGNMYKRESEKIPVATAPILEVYQGMVEAK